MRRESIREFRANEGHVFSYNQIALTVVLRTVCMRARLERRKSEHNFINQEERQGWHRLGCNSGGGEKLSDFRQHLRVEPVGVAMGWI